MSKLTPKQDMFCRDYLVDLNATAAAKRAGYSPRTAKSQGQRLLTNVDVAERIQELSQARQERVQVTADDVLRILYNDVTADVSELYDDRGELKPIHDWPLVFRQGLVAGIDTEELFQGHGKDREYIGETKKIKLADRTRLKELLGKHTTVKAFSDNLDLSSSDGSMTPTVIERTIVYPPTEETKP